MRKLPLFSLLLAVVLVLSMLLPLGWQAEASAAPRAVVPGALFEGGLPLAGSPGGLAAAALRWLGGLAAVPPEGAASGSGLLASRLLRYPVLDQAGNQLGQVINLLVDTQSGCVPYVVMAYASNGGLIGERAMAVPLNVFRLDQTQQTLTLNADTSSLSGAPAFSAFAWPDMTQAGWNTGVSTYWQRYSGATAGCAGFAGATAGTGTPGALGNATVSPAGTAGTGTPGALGNATAGPTGTAGTGLSGSPTAAATTGASGAGAFGTATPLATTSTSGMATSSATGTGTGTNGTPTPAATTAGQTTAGTVNVTLREFAIEMPSSLPAGPVSFMVTNAGTLPHNFEITGQGLHQKFSQDLQPGASSTMQMTLPAGSYQVDCPVDNHRGQGMQLTLTVGGSATTGTPGATGSGSSTGSAGSQTANATGTPAAGASGTGSSVGTGTGTGTSNVTGPAASTTGTATASTATTASGTPSATVTGAASSGATGTTTAGGALSTGTAQATPGALTTSAGTANLVRVTQLAGYRITSAGGQAFGNVWDVVLDPNSGQVQYVLAAPAGATGGIGTSTVGGASTTTGTGTPTTGGIGTSTAGGASTTTGTGTPTTGGIGTSTAGGASTTTGTGTPTTGGLGTSTVGGASTTTGTGTPTTGGIGTSTAGGASTTTGTGTPTTGGIGTSTVGGASTTTGTGTPTTSGIGTSTVGGASTTTGTGTPTTGGAATSLVAIPWSALTADTAAQALILKAPFTDLSAAPTLTPGTLPDMSRPGWDQNLRSYWQGAGAAGAAAPTTGTTIGGAGTPGATIGAATSTTGTTLGGTGTPGPVTGSGTSAAGTTLGGTGTPAAGATPATVLVPGAAAASGTVMRGHTIIGYAVKDPQGKNLGRIAELIGDLNSNSVLYAVVGFGGFLGIGEQSAAVPWTVLNLDQSQQAFILNGDQQMLSQAPALNAQAIDSSDPNWDANVRSYWEQRGVPVATPGAAGANATPAASGAAAGTTPAATLSAPAAGGATPAAAGAAGQGTSVPNQAPSGATQSARRLVRVSQLFGNTVKASSGTNLGEVAGILITVNSGPTGATSTTGTTGAAGATSTTGAGAAGATSTTGTGAAGATSTTGAGAAGATSTTGTGAAGATSTTGAAGATSTTGAAGATSTTGTTGAGAAAATPTGTGATTGTTTTGQSGSFAYVIVGFGGFLGIGEQTAAVPWSAFTIDPQAKTFTGSFDEATFRKAPTLDVGKLTVPPTAGWDTGIRAYWAGAGTSTPAAGAAGTPAVGATGTSQ